MIALPCRLNGHLPTVLDHELPRFNGHGFVARRSRCVDAASGNPAKRLPRCPTPAPPMTAPTPSITVERTPAPVPFDPDQLARTVPACLRALRQWVCWRYIERGGKPTKCPINASTGRKASSTNSTSWTTFEHAVTACKNGNALAGVGFVFGADDPFAGVDIDNCIGHDGRIKPWAVRIVRDIDSYAEISPSGRGIKIFARARKPGLRCKTGYEDGAVEMYDTGRFFTVTGHRIPDASADAEKRQSELDAVYNVVFGSSVAKALAPSSGVDTSNNGRAPLDDGEIIRLACASRKSGAKFATLWAGGWEKHFNSPSEADSSVVFTLAFYTKDASQIDRIFRQSGLMRDKWDEQHGQQTYGEMTIAKALATVTGQYLPGRPSQQGTTPDKATDDARRDAEGAVPLGQRDPETGRLVLSPKETLPTARAFVEEFHLHPEGRTLHSYAGTIVVWRGNRFVEIEQETLRQRLQPWLHEALRYRYNRLTESMELVDFESNPSTIKSAVESIRAYAHLPATITPTIWLSDSEERPDPRDLLPCATGNLHVPTGRMLPSTPALFNVNALEFDYDADAEAPERWIKFLEQLWDDDIESVSLLQEWLGYCLVGDTSQHKMLLIVGPRRSGKGTIARVLTRLVGPGNVCGPTTSSLAGLFGLQPLIGKSVAIVSDARFSGKDVQTVVERLLCVSGEDSLTIDRKHMTSVTMRLTTRFVFLTNELPRLADASGALSGRFMMLRLTESFYGREDKALTAKLLTELPGIVNWAIEGWRRLRTRGHFLQPASVEDALRDMEDLSSPVGAFVRERCDAGPGLRIWIDDLYAAWKEWCEGDGRISVTTKQTFGRDLMAAVAGIVSRQGTNGVRFYQGIVLKR